MGGLGCHLPLVGARKIAPLIYPLAQLIDDRSGIILLLGSGDTFAFVKNDLLLIG